MKLPANYSNLVLNYVEYFQSSSDVKKVDLQIKKKQLLWENIRKQEIYEEKKDYTGIESSLSYSTAK